MKTPVARAPGSPRGKSVRPEHAREQPMTKRRSWRRGMWSLAAAGLAALLSGSPARAGDHLPATIPEDLGTAVHRIFHAQATVAGQDRFVVYELEWRGDSAE